MEHDEMEIKWLGVAKITGSETRPRTIGKVTSIRTERPSAKGYDPVTNRPKYAPGPVSTYTFRVEMDDNEKERK